MIMSMTILTTQPQSIAWAPEPSMACMVVKLDHYV